jgi:hypothetical protein
MLCTETVSEDSQSERAEPARALEGRQQNAKELLLQPAHSVETTAATDTSMLSSWRISARVHLSSMVASAQRQRNL